jgi:twinkle protein
MKYQSSNTRLVYQFNFEPKKRYKCPECGDSSKRGTNIKDLEYYEKEGTAYCFKCNTTMYPYKPFDKKKEYKLPERINDTKLSDVHLKYWEGRMISQSTLNAFNVYSKGDWMCFPFIRGGEWVNIKARTIDKKFMLVSGAELIWYNFDALDNKELIICEGEGEVLTWYENGYKNVVSVPNGAGTNLEYLDSSIEMFSQIEKIILAVDNDEKGIVLRDELARRIGAEKCVTVSFRECKDGNDYFLKHGGLKFKELIYDAKPIPIKGIVSVGNIESDILDLYENGIKPGKTIEHPEIDQFCTWELGRLAIVTGVPGSGKSEIVDYIVTKLNLLHGWKAAYFTPENYPLKFHYAKLHEKYSGKQFKKNFDDGTFYGVYEHIKNNFHYIMNEEDMTVKTVIDNAKLLVRHFGVKQIVIDPYNRLEHAMNKNETETQYISRFLDELTMFGKIYNVLIFLVAHPRKMQRGEVPSLYDISGSANFFNKTDYGFTVHRIRGDNNMMTNEVEIHWQKIKFKHLGEQGVSLLRYNYVNGRLEDRVDVNSWDNSNWLYSQPKDNSDITDTVNEIPF